MTLHDEFDGVNKDVFVENSGTSPIYVRVRLDEFLQIGDTIAATGADVKDKSTWTPHTYAGESLLDCGNADVLKFHDYYQWTMTGAERDYTPGTPGMVYTKLGEDGLVNRSDISGADVAHHTSAATAPVLLSKAIEIAAIEELDRTAEEQEIWAAIQAGCWLLDDTDTSVNGGGWAYWSKALTGHGHQPAAFQGRAEKRRRRGLDLPHRC